MIILDEEIYCNILVAVILFQCRMNTLRLKWRQGFVGRVMDCPLCGAVEETVSHFVTEFVVLKMVREQFGVTREEVLEEKLLSKYCYRGVGGEEHHVVRGDVEEEKKKNGLTNARTCTSVVWAHRGADKMAGP